MMTPKRDIPQCCSNCWRLKTLRSSDDNPEEPLPLLEYRCLNDPLVRDGEWRRLPYALLAPNDCELWEKWVPPGQDPDEEDAELTEGFDPNFDPGA